MRYRIRAARDQRIAQFEAMAKHLKAIGFVHADEKAFELDLLDPAAESVVGTLPSSKVSSLFQDENIKTVLLVPSGSKLPDDPKQAVQLNIELNQNLSAAEQKLLHAQAVGRLALMGFRQTLAYDHLAYTRIRGSLPAEKVPYLLKDLRGLPTGWFVGGSDRDALPLPIRSVLPIRVVTVLPDLPAVAPSATVPSGKLTPDLHSYLSDATTAEKPIVVEAILENEPGDLALELRSKIRAAIPSLMVEGFTGSAVLLRLPRAALVKNVAALEAVRTVRFPRSANETVTPTTENLSGFVLDSRVDRLHSLGYTGAGVGVAVVASEFPGLERKTEKGLDGKTVERVSLAGVLLPPGSYLFDMTGEVNPTLDQRPGDPNRGSAGTAAALAVQMAAPQSPLILVRIDPARMHQLLTVARAVTGHETFSTAMYTRSDELSLAGAVLVSRRQSATAEYERAFSDLSDNEKAVKRRTDASAEMKALQAAEADYKHKLDRFLTLRAGLQSLRGMSVVVNTLVWESGYPQDAQSELSRVLESTYTVGTNVSSIRANKKATPTPIWVQAAGMSRGSVWSGPYLDVDGNAIMEFAPSSAPVPAGKWSRELNFLSLIRPEGNTTRLPAGTKIRLSLQWREPHSQEMALLSEPAYPLGLELFRQLDPEGKKVASDELIEVARSSADAVRLYKTSGSGVYEVLLETVIPEEGVYAVRVERLASAVKTVSRQSAELRPRLFAELLDSVSGRLGFDTFAETNAGVAVPGDSPAAVTIGTSRSLTGVGPGVTLGVKPELLADAAIEVSGKRYTGSGVAAGFAGGAAACLLGAGAKPSDLIKTAQLRPGSNLVLPDEWLQTLRPKTTTNR
jgi:hypothetical protein